MITRIVKWFSGLVHRDVELWPEHRASAHDVIRYEDEEEHEFIRQSFEDGISARESARLNRERKILTN